MVPGGWVSFAFTDYANLWGQPGPFIAQFVHEAKQSPQKPRIARRPARSKSTAAISAAT